MIPQQIKQTTLIDAPKELVRDLLTQPGLMEQWMDDPGMDLKILSNWKIGHPVVIQGFHNAPFENKGTVLHYEAYESLKYNYLSSSSFLPGLPENYTRIEFLLSPLPNQTSLTLVLLNFKTWEILNMYSFIGRQPLKSLKKQ